MLDVRTNGRDGDVRCPFCHTLVQDWDRVWACPGCETLHHQDCARENEQCTLLGCGAPVNVAAEGLPPVERSLRTTARGRQDFLVLGVSFCAWLFAFFSERVAGSRDGGLGGVVLALVAVGVVAAVFRYVRRWNRIGR
jgi:hypothetical protein